MLDEHIKALDLRRDEEINHAVEKLCKRCGIDMQVAISGDAKVQGVVSATIVNINKMSFNSNKD